MKRIGDEEIKEALRHAYIVSISDDEAVAQAQLDADREEAKEIFEWGDENCTEHTHKNYGSKVKRECCYCWQALKQKHLGG